MENFICNQYRERFAILNTENIKICGRITKVEATKMQVVCFFFNICRKFEVLITQLCFQRAACSRFQTCILNSHKGHTMCGSMADIQSAAAEIRRGKKEEKRTNDRMKI